MSAELDVEQLQTTKSEKLLALVLAGFLLIGGIWAYQEIDDRVRAAMPLRGPSATELQSIRSLDRAQQRRFRAEVAVRRTRDELELRREAYRTALDAGDPAGALRARYRIAGAAFDRARADKEAATRAEVAARPAATAAQDRLNRDVDKRHDRQELVIFLLRAAASALFVLTGYLLLTRLRDKGSRWFPLSLSVVLFATVFAFVVAIDYLTDYFDPFDAGILLLAVIGAAATIVAFWLLQRYLARRLPLRRVRHRQCPYCGFPVEDSERCEGCGREVQAPCAHCAAPRRIGAPFCGACGQA
ncbi:MAG: Double zinc ribbon [Gaiellaceae bacterium]|nr:Double zinc ribbon [Gaiellaceae bacterium]